MYKEQGSQVWETESSVYQARSRSSPVWGSVGTSYWDCDKRLDFLASFGVRTNDYWQRVKDNRLLPLTYWKQYEVNGERASAGTWKLIYKPNGDWNEYRMSGQLSSTQPGWRLLQKKPPYGAQSLYEQLKSRVSSGDVYVQKAWDEIYSKARWDALTFVAELNQTAEMLMNFYRRLADFKQRFSNKVVRRTRSSPGKPVRSRDFGNPWLESRYGIRTLWYDLKSIADAVTKFDEKRRRYKERQGTTEKWTVNSPYSGTFYKYGDTDCTDDEEHSLSIRGSVICDLELPSALIINPFNTAWELIPLSFVEDWLFDVGRWIRSLSALVLSSESYSAVGLHYTLRRTLTATWFPSRASDAVYELSGTVWEVGSSTETFTLRIPRTVSKLPLYQLNLDEYKIWDLAQIIQGSLNRRK